MLKTVFACILLVLSYCTDFIAAGHGEAPAGFILVFGRAYEYLPSMVMGWLGIVALGIGLILSGRRSVSAIFRSGVVLLILSWAGLLWVSQWRTATIASSLPFLLLPVWVLQITRSRKA